MATLLVNIILMKRLLADAVDEDDGSITIRILSDPAVTDTYNVGGNSSHTTTVVDDDDSSLPNISITGGTNVVEGADAVFTITATQAGSATTSSSESTNKRSQETF